MREADSTQFRDADGNPPQSVSEVQAIAELLRRQRARESLVEYARAIEIPGDPKVKEDPEAEVFKPIETDMALHHRIMLEEMQRCIETDDGRLLIMAPPGSAKSTYEAVAASWAMSKYPDYRVILASYATDIASKHSRKVRAMKRDPKENAIWTDRPTLAADQRAVADWKLTNSSEFMAAGLLAGITGNRADLVFIDDPVKGREEADSQIIRDKTEEEYRDSLTSRLKPRASVIAIMTRWHEDDMMGRILPEDYAGESGDILCRDGLVWRVLRIPAKAESPDDPLGRTPGEYLWPEWFPEKHWKMRENDPRGQRTWSSLYQQRPTPGDGIDFQREWFHFYDPDVPAGLPGGRPGHLVRYGASDFASSSDRSADFTEHGMLGVDPNFDFWFEDWWFGQKTSDVYIGFMMGLARRWKPIRWWHEGGPIGRAIAPHIVNSQRLQNVYFLLDPMTNINNKAVKLSSFQAMAAAGRVHFPLKRPWATRVIEQLVGFPAARYDDAADVCGLFGRGIENMMAAHQPRTIERPKVRPFTEAWWTQEDTTRPKIRYT